MGIGVNSRGILTIEAYERGLRLKFMRIFGPFNKPAFVPWKDIQIEKKTSFFLKGATFTFGTGDDSIQMGIEEDLTNNLWRTAGNLWPEKGTPPGPFPQTGILKIVFRKWLFRTTFASLFFILAPRIAWPDHLRSFPPVLVAILFPAIVFGIGCLYEYSKKTEDQNRSGQ
jgi:hypothetical protein